MECSLSLSVSCTFMNSSYATGLNVFCPSLSLAIFQVKCLMEYINMMKSVTLLRFCNAGLSPAFVLALDVRYIHVQKRTLNCVISVRFDKKTDILYTL